MIVPGAPAPDDAGRLGRPKWMVGAAVAALVAAAFAVSWVIRYAIPGMTFVGMLDLEVYRAGGRSVVAGQPLYGFLLQNGSDALPFTYSPAAALAFVPLALLGTQTAYVGWTALNVLALGAVLWLCLGRLGVRAARTRAVATVAGTLAAHLLDPVIWNLVFGQINVLLMLLVLLDVLPVTGRLRGLALGIAAGIKLTPLIFVVYLCCIGRWRDGLRALAVFAATVLAGFAVLPSDSRDYWFHGVFADVKRVLTAPIGVNHSLSGLFSRIAESMDPPPWSLPLCALAGVCGLLLAVRAHRLGHEVLGVVFVGFTAVLVSPVTWPAHAVWVVPALAWLATARWRRGSRLPRVVLVAAFVWFTVPVYWLAQRLPDGDVVFQYTPPGFWLATLGGLLPPVLLGLATAPCWLPRLAPPQQHRDVPEPA